MSATLTVRHTVADYAAWRAGYDDAETIRNEHGCTSQRVFPTVGEAQAFVDDPTLQAAMQRAGVTSAPRIEIYELV